MISPCDYLRRHRREISLSLLDRIRVCVLAADEPAALERDAIDLIDQWTEVPGRQLDDYRVILKAIDSMPFASERAASELEALCSARGIYQ